MLSLVTQRALTHPSEVATVISVPYTVASQARPLPAFQCCTLKSDIEKAGSGLACEANIRDNGGRINLLNFQP